MNNLKISDINLRTQVDQTQAAAQPDGQLRADRPGRSDQLDGARPDHRAGHLAAPVPSGYFDALRNIFGVRRAAVAPSASTSPTRSAGARSRRPSPARSCRSNRRRRTSRRSQLQIATDVANAALTVQSSLESVQAVGRWRASSRRTSSTRRRASSRSACRPTTKSCRRSATSPTRRTPSCARSLNYRKALVNFETVQTVGTRGVGAAVGSGTGGTGTTTAAPTAAAADSNSEPDTDHEKAASRSSSS